MAAATETNKPSVKEENRVPVTETQPTSVTQYRFLYYLFFPYILTFYWVKAVLQDISNLTHIYRLFIRACALQLQLVIIISEAILKDVNITKHFVDFLETIFAFKWNGQGDAAFQKKSVESDGANASNKDKENGFPVGKDTRTLSSNIDE